MANVAINVTAEPRRDDDAGPAAARPRRLWHPEAIAVVIVSGTVSAVAVLRHIGTKPLWRDEAISLSVASRPVLRILSILPRHDGNAGFYYLLLHVWVTAGRSPAWARGFSAACFVATAALAGWAGWRWRGWDTGLACGLLVALNPFLVYYGQEARPYALAVLLAVAATMALFWRADPDGRQPAPRAFAVIAIGLAYADLFALLYLGALVAVVVVFYWRQHRPVPGVFKRQLGWIMVVSAPLAVLMSFFERGQISWLARPTVGVLVSTITAMTSGGLGLAAVVVLALVALVDRSKPGQGDTLIVVALAAAFAIPPLVLWGVAQVVPAYIDRYVICSAAAMVGLVAAGLAAVRARLAGVGRGAALVILAGLLLLAGQHTARVEAQPFKVDNGPAVVQFIQAQARAGDAIAYAGGGLRTLVEATLSPAGRAAFPPDVALAPGGEAYFQHDLYAREVGRAELASRLEAIQRLWMVTDPGDQSYPLGGPFAAVKPLVTASFGSAGTASFGAIDVTLLVRRP